MEILVKHVDIVEVILIVVVVVLKDFVGMLVEIDVVVVVVGTLRTAVLFTAVIADSASLSEADSIICRVSSSNRQSPSISARVKPAISSGSHTMSDCLLIFSVFFPSS